MAWLLAAKVASDVPIPKVVHPQSTSDTLDLPCPFPSSLRMLELDLHGDELSDRHCSSLIRLNASLKSVVGF